MTYEEFQKLSPDVLARLRALKLPSHLQNRVEIAYYRNKSREKLYHVAVQAKKHKLIDFTPKPKPKPKPKPVPPIVENKENIAPLPDKPIPVKLPSDKPYPIVLDGGDDDGKES